MTEQTDVEMRAKAIQYAKSGEVHRLAAFQQIDEDQIQASFEQAEQYFLQALDLCEDKGMLCKTQSWIHAHLGVTYLSLADLVEKSRRNICLNNAEQHLREAMDLPSEVGPEPSNSAYAWGWAHLGEVFTWQAYAYLQQADKREQYLDWAIEAFDKALTPPDHLYVWAYAHRGLAYRIKGILSSNHPGRLNPANEAALDDFQKAFALDSSYYWAAANLATLYRERGIQKMAEGGMFKSAAEDLRLALEYFQYVTIRDPFLFVHMNVLETDPLGMGANPPTDAEIKKEAVYLSELYRESVRVFRKHGPTAQARTKIDAFLSA